jgi:hypothetical protein
MKKPSILNLNLCFRFSFLLGSVLGSRGQTKENIPDGRAGEKYEGNG